MSQTVENVENQVGVNIPLRKNQPWVWQTLRLIGTIVGLTLIALLFYKSTFTCMSDRNSVDIAQIARNISVGNGFTTSFVRPFNIGFSHELASRLPEVNHAPLYPYVLAGLFRVKTPCDQVVVWLSLFCYVMTAVATYMLGRIAFSPRVGLLAICLLGLNARVLAVAVSGQEWTMAAMLFGFFLCSLAVYHRCAASGPFKCIAYGALSGVLMALMYATSYSLIVLLIPSIIYFAFTGSRKWLGLAAFLIVTLGLISPIMYNNFEVTGNPVLGGNAWDIMANTTVFPLDTFYRSVNPDQVTSSTPARFVVENFAAMSQKMFSGFATLSTAISITTGILVLPFAIVGMLYRFKYPQANAIRGFCYGAIVVLLIIFSALNVRDDAIIVISPVVLIMASGYLFLLLDSKKLHPFYCQVLLASILVITALPAITAIVWKPSDAVVKKAVDTSRFFATGKADVVYTDVPWLASWRMEGRAVWLPRNTSDVDALEAAGHPMSVVVLTSESRQYGDDELWKALYASEWWRDYLQNEQLALEELRKSYEAYLRTHGEDTSSLSVDVKRTIENHKRTFSFSIDRIREFQVWPPPQPTLLDGIIVLQKRVRN